MKFIHTSDWQIGMKAAHIGAAASRVREERLSAARRLIEVARQAGADFILLAGDTFEDNGIDRILVQRVSDILASFRDPVYVIPGNHDPLVPGSVWEHPAWRSSQNIRVLRQEQPSEIPGGILYPCPARERHSRKDPTAWISVESPQRIRIGLAHGTVEGVQADEPDYPIPREAPSRAALDYLAVGHWHSTVTYVGADGAVRLAYSGTHEATGFGERDSGNALFVDIPEPGAHPIIRQVRTGALSWKMIEADLREPGDLVRVREQVEASDNPASTLLEVRIAGLLAARDRHELARLDEIVASRFLFGRVEASRLRPSPEDESWLTGLPEGVVREAASRLRDLANPVFAGQRPEGATTEAASRALLELCALVTEVTS
jgi:DNA repair exonuclease SbcCD nuclease subunit